MNAPSSNDSRRLYTDLAWTFPIISKVEDYADEAEELWAVAERYSVRRIRTVLDLGSGLGHNDFFLKRHAKVWAVDSNEMMLKMASQNNPEVTYVRGDMRTVRFGNKFDVVLIADAMDYMLTVDDLNQALATAAVHLEDGGVFITYFEKTKETFRHNETKHSIWGKDGVEITYIENYYDPDPSDSVYEMTFVNLIRRNGKLDVEVDTHMGGLFWEGELRQIIGRSNFDIKEVSARSYGLLFACTKRP